MQIIRGLHNLKMTASGCVASVGNFDGVHLGHQMIIQRVQHWAKEFELPSIIMIFEPQPEEIFAKNGIIPPRLTKLREKIDIFQNYDIDQLLIVPFDSTLAELTAEQFVQHILVEHLKIKHLVIGDDFHFGKNRLGGFDYLRNVAEQFGFTVESVATVALDEKSYPLEHIPPIKRRISSTWIREALQDDDLEMAQKLLGRPYSLCGRVSHGDQIGRTLGIPTINIHLQRRKSPLQGVYVVQVDGIGPHLIYGIADIGFRPTIQKATHPLRLEVHLFDFDQEIYDNSVKVTFLHKLRAEQKFESLERLKEQIPIDIGQAKKYLREKGIKI